MKPLPRLMLALATLACTAFPSLTGAEKKKETLGTIVRKDPAFDRLIGPDAVLEKLSNGFHWAEGPVWVPREGGYLLFSDIPPNRVYRWKDGRASVFLEPSGYTGTGRNLKEPGSNGLLLDPDGRLVLCQHGDRRVARLEADGKTFKTLADHYKDKRLNSPNDGVFHSSGDLYFTDPPYGLMVKDAEGFPGQELDFCGVYRLSRDGTLTLLTREMSKPNGIAFSPDEKTLYVANSDPMQALWVAFPVKSDGTLGKGRVFKDVTSSVGPRNPGLPDGMKVDRDGNLFATGPGGVLVFSPDGKHLGTIATGVPTANCAWGEDGTVLYVTADKSLTRIQTRTRGKGF